MENVENEEKTKRVDEAPKASALRTWPTSWVVVTAVVIAVVSFSAGSLITRRHMNTTRTVAQADVRADFPLTQGRVQGGGLQGGVQRQGMPVRGERGTTGALTKIDGDTLTIRSQGQDVTVAVSSSTSYYKQGSVTKQADLVVGDILTVSGNSDSSGVIQATAISIR